jgi:hypothetical protein
VKERKGPSEKCSLEKTGVSKKKRVSALMHTREYA